MIRLILIALVAFVGIEAQAQMTKTVSIENSVINWTGSKLTGKHTGTLHLSDGSLQFTDGKLTGGAFTIDMTSLASTDLEGGKADKLLGHLKSDDFFSVATYPTAHLKITEVGMAEGAYAVTADLTIKGKTAPVSFVANIDPSGANADITVDRTVYDVRYGSDKFFDNLGNKAINDNFDLNVSLAF